MARFLYSHAYYKKNKGRYEFIRLLGPDEYHENVDNNAFTNYQAYYSLEKALTVSDRLKVENLELWGGLKNRLSLSESELIDWQDMLEKLYLPQPLPESGIIEQFDGYFELEDVTPKTLEQRLIKKNEYWGWPNGVAVHTQVLKQADVLQLLVLQDLFPRDVVRANYDYYETKTQHGSSLSPSVHAIIAVKAGYLEQAYSYFTRSSVIDLFNTNKAESGGTFIGGIHTASCGAAWQIIVFGFAGMKVNEDGLSFKPMLPEKWEKVKFKINYNKQKLILKLEKSGFKVDSDRENTVSVTVQGYDQVKTIEPGDSARFDSN